MLIFVLAVSLALVFTFICSISEAVLLSVGHAEIEALGKSRAGRLLRDFKREIDDPLAAILILSTIANTLGSAIAGGTYPTVFNESSLWFFSLLFTVAILVVSEIIPKTLGVSFSGHLAAPVALSVRALVIGLRPLLFLTRAISRGLRGSKLRPVTSIDEIRLLASLGRTEGAVGRRTAELIEGAAALRELTAYDVMVPRAGVTVLSGARSLEENLSEIRRTGHSRFPFAQDGDLDKVEGIILAKELLFRLRETTDTVDYRALLGPLVVVPASLQLERLLRTFQEERRHMAIVVDEYGGTQGLVTLEDVLEEIVGEIEDESDRVNPHIVRRPDDSLVCRGWAETRKVFEVLGIDDEDVEMVTIGGFVAELVGRVPRVGDSVEWRGYRFTVLRATARRAERIEIRKLSNPARNA
ncbi:MAG TPA: hemolysin family protein [Polyangiaceae bacterium]|jgi:CBS domain containing-hemolysin-like protein